ncbi:MAG TPA: aminoacyl-histidine dipeptidase [Bacteroidota bacterium]|nr:aminoacyl-histidine dipeptidase [Bacteroidota bacterium]
MSTEAIAGLQPQLVWKHFAAISRIPRGSKNEKAIGDYVVDAAARSGLVAKRDKFGNVVVKKPAHPSHSHAKIIALQGHLDMVCEKNADTVHDFTKDPIDLVRKGNLLMANGTTLGADNGVAVATNLAIMEDKTLEHGPLEFLFTVDEETGLTGASNLSGNLLESKTLLNLDSEEEGALYVGCSGGRDTVATFKHSFEPAPRQFVAARIQVKGLKGGHSGLEIDKNRGNAIKILNRVLIKLSALGARLSAFEGGNKRNAIPRECEALVFLPGKKLAEARLKVGELQSIIKAEISSVDPDLSITLGELPASKKAKVVKKTQQQLLCKAIAALPHGVLKMSSEIAGLVETSTNVAVISTTKKAFVLATSQRSSVASELDETVETVTSILELSGAKVENSDGYPGWKPNLSSPILRLAKETYKSLYGKEPAVKAIHAGLECGILGEKFPGMDMVSFGPTLEGVHSPDEKIYIDTVERFWRFLLAILKNVN